MIIWGSTGKETAVGTQSFFCPTCQAQVACTHKKVSRYFTLYFIPLFETQVLAEYVECNACGNQYSMEVLLVAQDPNAGILFACRSCGTTIHAKRSAAGTQGQCPRCKTVCVVPPARQMQAPVVGPAAPVADAPPAAPLLAPPPVLVPDGGRARQPAPRPAPGPAAAASPAAGATPWGYALCCLPLLLLIVGGMLGHATGGIIGGVVGILASAANIVVYRVSLERPLKAALFAGGGVVAFVLVMAVTGLVAARTGAPGVENPGSAPPAGVTPTAADVKPKPRRDRTVVVPPTRPARPPAATETGASTVPAKVPAAPPLTPGVWTELARDLDPKACTVAGTWANVNGTLTNKPGATARIEVPVMPVGSYELSLTFNRKAGRKEFIIQTPVVAGAAQLWIGGMAGQSSHIEGAGGRELPGAPTILDNRDQRLDVRVLVSGQDVDVSVNLDGTPYLAYKGPWKRLSVSDRYSVPEGLGFGVHPFSTMEFKDIRMCPLPDTAGAPVK